MKNYIHTSKPGLRWSFLGNFLVVTIIDIHQMNLELFGSLNFLVENSLKVCFFSKTFSNKGKIIYVFED
jgi:hypothetical protein